MKAVVQDKYGPIDVLELREVDRPLIEDRQVLVHVRAASVHADVWHMVSGHPYVLRLMGAGRSRPKNPIPGTDMAGVVAEVGEKVTRFRPGDAVFGETVSGNQWNNGGAFAEYVAVAEDALELKPARLTFEQAAAVPTSGLIALRSLLVGGQLRSGQKVLINGAGGAVGTFAVQIAKAFGATVTGVDHPRKLEMVRSIGADHVIDYTKEDFTRGSERYDIVLDVASNLSFRSARRVLTSEGTYVLIGHDNYGESGGRWLGSLPRFMGLMAITPLVGHLQRASFSTDMKALFRTLLELLEAGKITPVIDRTFPLSQVREAMHHLMKGQPRGKVIITL